MNKLIMSGKDVGQRLDKWLLRRSKLPWNYINRVLRKKELKISGIHVTKDYRLKNQDLLEYPKYLSLETPILEPSGMMDTFKKWIVYEDDDILVINKPAGIASQGGVGVKISIDVLAAEYSESKINHRLDKNVSGLLVLGKTPEGCVVNIKDKTYYAIATGQVPESGVVSVKIGKVGIREGVCENGKQATTYYECIEKLVKEKEYSLVKLRLETGRKHQIRVHLGECLKAPILGDFKYGGEDMSRIYLHAYSVLAGGKLFTAPLPNEFQLKISELGFKTVIK